MLDKQLKEILTKCRKMEITEDEQVKAIKVAFADEGYKREWSPDNTFAMPRKVLAKLPKYHANSGVSHMYSNVGAKQICMTGQEFYDRFVEELYKPAPQERIKHDDDGESHDRFYRAGGTNFMYNQALEAAKRAAGLTDLVATDSTTNTDSSDPPKNPTAIGKGIGF